MMKQASVGLGLVLAVAGCGGSTPEAQAPAPAVAQWDALAAQDLKASMEAANQAWASGDLAAIEAGWASDAFLVSYDVGPTGPSVIDSKDAMVKMAREMFEGKKGQGATSEMTIKRVECQATSTFGVCVNEFDVTMKMGDKAQTFSFRGTGTGRKGSDGWKWTHWHGSLAKMPEMPPAAPPAPPPPLPAFLEPVAVQSKDLKWMEPPGAPKGLKVAPVWGNMMAGPGAAFVDFSKGMKEPRHFHPANTWVHIIKGSMKVIFVNGNVVELGAGGFGFLPKNVQHSTEVKVGTLAFQYADDTFGTVMVDEQGKPLPPPAAPASGPGPAPAAPPSK